MGAKGSGRALTPEGRENRRISAKNASDSARRARGGGSLDTDPEDDTIEPEVVPPAGKKLDDEEILALLPGSNPYDKVVLKSRNRFTYLDGKTREQVRGVELTNQKLDTELQSARGKLLTKEQVAARDEATDLIILAHFDHLVEFVASTHPPDVGNGIRARARSWVNDTKQKIAAELLAVRK